jgi:UDP-N-acetylmuramoyl-tripeptide--D-alanyl-D-alanine ligase
MIFSAEALAEATGGTLVRPGPAGPIDTDSRRLRPGSWFVALVGERFDGHSYLPHASAAGCAGCIASRVPEDWTGGFIQVPDTLVALQNIARYVRDGFDGPVVGITGSAGKTTTRALTALALSSLGPVHQTSGNLNNHIGLPLTLLSAPADAAAWVLEMGMNHAGEIALLQDIGRPDVRLITNVGAAHTEGVGGIAGVAAAKQEIFDGARPGDVCVINADDPYITAMPLPEGVRVIRFGTAPGCDVRLTAAAVDPDTLHTRFQVETPTGTVLSEIRSPGTHLAMNAAAAIAVGLALHCPAEQMARAIAGYEPVGARQRVIALPDGPVVLDDSYNANPLSTAASLRTLAAVTGRRRIALLGDMLELGGLEESAHAELLALARSLSLDLIGLAGPRYAAAWRAADAPEGVLCAPDARALAERVGPRISPGDVVLLKGSRGMAMERILDTLNTSR